MVAQIGCQKFLTLRIAMDMTFQEKSIAGSLLFIAVLFSYYFSEVYQVVSADSAEGLIRLPFIAIGVVVALIVLEAVYHAVIAVHRKPEDPDERDALIEARASRIGYFVLLAANIFVVGHLMLNGIFEFAGRDDVLGTPIMAANFVLFSIIIAEIARFAAQLVFYRRGV